MTTPEFEAEVAEIRCRCERLRSSGATIDQLIGLGAELQAQQMEIIEVFRRAGKMYRPAPWV
jgi:hypothetical protein